MISTDANPSEIAHRDGKIKFLLYNMLYPWVQRKKEGLRLVWLIAYKDRKS